MSAVVDGDPIDALRKQVDRWCAMQAEVRRLDPAFELIAERRKQKDQLEFGARQLRKRWAQLPKIEEQEALGKREVLLQQAQPRQHAMLHWQHRIRVVETDDFKPFSGDHPAAAGLAGGT